jgi:hypothetical protein
MAQDRRDHAARAVRRSKGVNTARRIPTLQRSTVRELKRHKGSITRCDYDREWPELFACEDDRIRAGSYTFTASEGIARWRFVVPTSTAPNGLPLAETTSVPFTYTAE